MIGAAVIDRVNSREEETWFGGVGWEQAGSSRSLYVTERIKLSYFSQVLSDRLK